MCRRSRRPCLLYTSDAADERSSVDLGGRRIIKKKKERDEARGRGTTDNESTPTHNISNELKTNKEQIL